MNKCYYCANQRGGCPECNRVVAVVTESKEDFSITGEVAAQIPNDWEFDGKEDTVCFDWALGKSFEIPLAVLEKTFLNTE